MPVATMTDAEIAKYTAKSWDEFCKDEAIKRDFGFDAFAARVKRKAGVADVSEATREQLIRALGDAVEQSMKAGLSKAHEIRMQENIPRAKQKQEHVNKDVPNYQSETARTEQAPWLKDSDFAGPAVEAFIRAAQNKSTDRQTLTVLHDKAQEDLQNRCENKYKARLAAQMRYRPSAAPDNKMR